MSRKDHLPTVAEIEAFVAEERAAGRTPGRREVARAFGLSPAQRIWLKRVMRDLSEPEGGDAPEPPPESQPRVVLVDITGRDRDGELMAAPADWPKGAGPEPRVLIGTDARRGAAPGIGDRALVRLSPLADHPHASHEGRLIKLMGREKRALIGVFRAYPQGGGRIEPVDRKGLNKELLVRPGDDGGARDGDLVSVSVTKAGFGPGRARVRERLGDVRSEKAVSLIAIHAHGLPNEFSARTMAEAQAAPETPPGEREDWRHLPLVTIDPADAKDHDDAVHAAPDEDPSNAGGHVLTVAIADVAAYVTPGSGMDREALERGNSVYFPDRVVPMLPERISNDLCSLKPNVDRPALAARIVIAADGRKLRHSFHRILMRSRAKLAYQQAQAAIDGATDTVSAEVRDGILRPLWVAYGSLKQARGERQPLDLDLPERKLILDAEGRLERVSIPERLDAHRLIEECMILANVCAAETLERAPTGLIWRVHDEPSVEKMRALGEVLASIGHKLPKAGALQPALFNRILKLVRGTEHEPFLNEVVLRTQAQAEYAAENYGHFGLNLRKYAHFTSPIRRYADLIVHRALIRHLRLGEDGLPPETTRAALAEISMRISAAERRAMAAERETVDRLVAHFLAGQIGASFDGRIAGVTRAGLFVKLAETGADGFVPASTLGADYYAYDEAAHALVGSRTGETFRLGDEVRVKLMEAAPVAGALRFEMVSEGRKGRPLPSRRGGFKPGGRPERKRSRKGR